MQMIYIGAALLVLAALGFLAVFHGGRWALRKWDAHTVLSHARKVERDAARRAANMARFSMVDFNGVRKS